MALKPDADVEITAFKWVPDFAQGLVRDLRLRWALEETGRDYRVRLLNALAPRPEEYFHEQPFGQVPFYKDNEVELFESGAILIHLGMQDERLLPTDHVERMRAIAWLIAALNSIEPVILMLISLDVFIKDKEAAKRIRPEVVDRLEGRLKNLSDALGDKEWLEGRFTIADLMMVAVLRQLRGARTISQFPSLLAYIERAEARPAFQRALADQLKAFKENEPAPQPA
jgi:glutathione S-transferase